MKEIALYAMALFYVFAGVMHFLKPKVYLKIVPAYLPFHLPLVYLSGVLEIFAGLLLLFPITRSVGAWLTILILIAVFPANVQMAISFYQKRNRYLWLAIARLPLQFLLIWWAWIYTK